MAGQQAWTVSQRNARPRQSAKRGRDRPIGPTHKIVFVGAIMTMGKRRYVCGPRSNRAENARRATIERLNVRMELRAIEPRRVRAPFVLALTPSWPSSASRFRSRRVGHASIQQSVDAYAICTRRPINSWPIGSKSFSRRCAAGAHKSRISRASFARAFARSGALLQGRRSPTG